MEQKETIVSYKAEGDDIQIDFEGSPVTLTVACEVIISQLAQYLFPQDKVKQVRLAQHIFDNAVDMIANDYGVS